MSESVRPAVSVSDGAVQVAAGQLNDRRDFVALIGSLARACDELWPINVEGWRNDPTRSGGTGTVGAQQAHERRVKGEK
jgi:hypothetical protein